MKLDCLSTLSESWKFEGLRWLSDNRFFHILWFLEGFNSSMRDTRSRSWTRLSACRLNALKGRIWCLIFRSTSGRRLSALRYALSYARAAYEIAELFPVFVWEAIRELRGHLKGVTTYRTVGYPYEEHSKNGYVCSCWQLTHNLGFWYRYHLPGRTLVGACAPRGQSFLL